MSTLDKASDGGLVRFEIRHADFDAVIDPENAFWSLVPKVDSCRQSTLDELWQMSRQGAWDFVGEIDRLRFGLSASAVYFNPTERCNLNCTYCYLPETIRRRGIHMSAPKMFEALERLRDFLAPNLPDGYKPQVIFHGSEPMMNRRNVFAAIEHFENDFVFGIQTNGSLLDDYALDFITSRNISLGLSLDGPDAEINIRTRRTFNGKGVFSPVINVLDRLKGYRNHSVITTVTTKNLAHLSEVVELFHEFEVPTCMLNPLRCTLPGALTTRPGDAEFSEAYLKAIERSRNLFLETGRKLVIANFANAVIAMIAPAARKLMCDISPCGAGRCFFAMNAKGDLFPCSEFIGLPEFNGGNIFENEIGACLGSEQFQRVTKRKIETMEPCGTCPIRHFCGAPCPAEAYALNRSIESPGAFCDFYKEQVRFIFRAIADGIEDDFLWDGWDAGLVPMFDTRGEAEILRLNVSRRLSVPS